MSEMGTHGRKKVSLENMQPTTSWVADSMSIITSLPSIIALFFQNFPVILISIIFCLVVFLVCLIYQLKIRQIEKSNDKKISEEGFYRSEREREYIDKSLLIKKWRKSISFLMVVCILFGAVGGNNLYKLVGKSMEGPNPVEGESDRKLRNASTLQQDGEETVTYEEVSNISFCLNEAIIPNLDNQDIEIIFYVLYQDKTVKEHIDELRAVQEKSGTKKMTDGEKKSVSDASTAESNFKDKVEEAKAYKSKRQMTDWQEVVPSVSDYKDDVIDKRIIIIDGEKGDADICFLVANDFQYIGDEYKKQDEDYRAVIYYWGQSIIYTEKALSYENLSEEDWKKYYGYLKMRYKDIADYIEKNWDKIEDGDKEIYEQWNDAARTIYKEM